ncbi:MFS transporter, partial [Paracoccus yeei]|uniref:MFS transporter n=1 Tax=Paracoccus yeei TaxID=147645 RepID=UPI0037C687E2
MKQVDSDISESRQSGVTATLALSMGMASLGTSIANIALPALATAFAAPFPQVQAVVVAYLATLTVSVVIAGRLGDHYGLKPMLVVGLSLFLAAWSCRECGGNCRAAGSGHVTMAPVRPRGQGTLAREAGTEFPSHR